MLLSTFDRVELASKLLKHYSRVRYVDHIFLIWHNPKTKPPPEIEEQAKKAKYPPITILRFVDVLGGSYWTFGVMLSFFVCAYLLYGNPCNPNHSDNWTLTTVRCSSKFAYRLQNLFAVPIASKVGSKL